MIRRSAAGIRVLCLALVCAALMGGCAPAPVQEQGFLLGTYYAFSAHGPRAREAIAQAIRRVERIDADMSAFSPGSDIGRLNAAPGQAVPISADTLAVLRAAADMYRDSGAAFNPMLRALLDEWGFTPERMAQTQLVQIPEAARIEGLMREAVIGNLSIDEADSTATLKSADAGVDLGSIAKGYALDRAVEALKQGGVENALVDLGGCIFALGRREGKRDWIVGIRHPRSDSPTAFATLAVGDRAVVTSGDYERFFLDEQGRRYHHILDGRRGYPADAGLISVTIVCDDATLGDALSTAVFVLGEEKGTELLARYPRVGYLLVYEDLTLAASADIKEMLTIINPEFTYR